MWGISIYSANGEEGIASQRKWYLSCMGWKRRNFESREGCCLLLVSPIHQLPLNPGPLHNPFPLLGKLLPLSSLVQSSQASLTSPGHIFSMRRAGSFKYLFFRAVIAAVLWYYLHDYLNDIFSPLGRDSFQLCFLTKYLLNELDGHSRCERTMYVQPMTSSRACWILGWVNWGKQKIEQFKELGRS